MVSERRLSVAEATTNRRGRHVGAAGVLAVFALVLGFQIFGAPLIIQSAIHNLLAQEAYVLLVGLAFLASGPWALWILLTFVISSVQWGIALYHLVRILITLVVLSVVRISGLGVHFVERIKCHRKGTADLQYQLEQATSMPEYNDLAKRLIQEEKHVEPKDNRHKSIQQLKEKICKEHHYNSRVVVQATNQLNTLLKNGNRHELARCIQSLLKRNFCGMDTSSLFLAHGDGPTTIVLESIRAEVESFDAAMIRSIEFVAANLRTNVQHVEKNSSNEGTRDGAKDMTNYEILRFMEHAKKTFGRSALCLSGGGSLSMYHFGVVQAMIESNTLPRVISGTSGGSIVAGMLAVKTDAELKREVLREDVAVLYKDEGIQWFPPIMTQIKHFLEEGVLLDNKEFQRCTKRYFGNFTFAEAYKRTGRIVNISVTVSGSSSSSGRLLLNHISTPHVFIWSAVATTCALPGIMNPVTLMAKGSNGEEVPFMAPGIDFVDGSLLADLPMKRLGELFGITNFIVSQVNPHVVKLLRKRWNTKTNVLWKLENVLQLDLRYRCQLLSKLGLIPKFFGQNIGGVFTQRYSGSVTIVPNISFADMRFAILNPSCADMRKYLLEGQRAFWPVGRFTCHLLAVERLLEKLVIQNRQKFRGARGEKPSRLLSMAHGGDSASNAMPSERLPSLSRMPSYSSLTSVEEDSPTPFNTANFDDSPQIADASIPRMRRNHLSHSNISTLADALQQLTVLQRENQTLHLENQNLKQKVRALETEADDFVDFESATGSPIHPSFSSPVGTQPISESPTMGRKQRFDSDGGNWF